MAVEGASSIAVAVVDCVAVAEKAQRGYAIDLAVIAAHRLGEPTERPGTEPAEDHSGLMGLAQHRVDPMRPPDAEQADQAATADIDHVLRQEVRADVRHTPLPSEEADVRWSGPVPEGVVEPHHVVVSIAARGGQEADARISRPREAEDVVVEKRVSRLLGEASTAESNNLSRRLHDSTPVPVRVCRGIVGAARRSMLGPMSKDRLGAIDRRSKSVAR